MSDTLEHLREAVQRIVDYEETPDDYRVVRSTLPALLALDAQLAEAQEADAHREAMFADLKADFEAQLAERERAIQEIIEYCDACNGAGGFPSTVTLRQIVAAHSDSEATE